MVEESEFLSLVSALYEAALGRRAWPEVLAHLAQRLGGGGTTLRWDPASPRPGDASAGLPAGITIVRPDGRQGWTAREAALLHTLGPHLRRALQIERRRAALAASRGRSGPSAGLSQRESDCLAWISRGASSKTVARQLSLSSHTVDQHIRSAMAKLGAATRTGAVIMALERGLLSPAAAVERPDPRRPPGIGTISIPNRIAAGAMARPEASRGLP
ncbi:response regulator transcription factor [Inquilinus sp.]|jgi:DNA-binding CsgD family transcriptional regulator|uniref:response regulator transcription factor n=1 Tax=Inquilinus sp. TaxID=1932117 RepID=UPI003782EDA2